MIANIITIGDEILIGQTVDTNSGWIGAQLNRLGIVIGEVVSISDNAEQIISSVDRCLKQCDLLLITGGLGPTRDDLTKATLCEYFGGKLVRVPEIEQRIVEFFTRFDRKVLEVNRQQADLPDNCTVLTNSIGTAAGMLWEKDQKVIVSMPGVPYEMKAIVEEELIPFLQNNKLPKRTVVHKNVLTAGIGESSLAEILKHWEDKVRNSGYSLAYLPNPGSVKLRVSYSGDKKEGEVNEVIAGYISELKSLIPEYFIAEEEKSFTKVVGKLLRKHGKMVGVVESCTGGAIAKLFTQESGCSSYFKGGVTAYNNDLKTSLIGVDPYIIYNEGAVSEACARELAVKGRDVLGVDYCISTTGVAGPDGGSEEKPVGLVYTAVAGPEGVMVHENRFGGNRNRIITRVSTKILCELLKMLQNDFSDSN